MNASLEKEPRDAGSRTDSRSGRKGTQCEWRLQHPLPLRERFAVPQAAQVKGAVREGVNCWSGLRQKWRV